MANDLESDLKDTIDDDLDTVLDYARRKNIKEQRKEYAADPLFSRFNLDTKEFVLAKSGGGLVTSIHRKVGDLIEKNVQHTFRERMGVDNITYDAKIVVDDEPKTRELDALLLLSDVNNGKPTKRLEKAIDQNKKSLNKNKSLSDFAEGGTDWRGMGFEIRHCYQSADAKRSQADIAMAQHLRQNDIMPIMLIFCEDSNQSVISRYRNHMFVFEGGDSFELVEDLTDFDYANFLDQQEGFIDKKMEKIFKMF